MSSRDLRTSCLPKIGFRARTLATATTTQGAAVDTSGYTDCLVIFEVGSITGSGTTLDMDIRESTASAGTYTAITGAAFAQVGTTSGGSTLYFGHIKLGRSGGPFLKCVAVTVGAAVSAPCALIYVLYNKVDTAAWSAPTMAFQVN